MIGDPGIILEIVNPFHSPVEFDEEGYPRSRAEGHGVGTQSIRYFAKRHGAVCHWQAGEGEFVFRLIL